MKERVARSYASPLREQQAEQTRARIVAAAVKLIEGGVEDLTVPLVAAEAQVALRTVFRYFPAREDLLDATWIALNEQLGDMPQLDGLDALTAFIPELFDRYARFEGQIRAVVFSSLLQDSRRRRGSARARTLRRTIDALAQGGDERSRRMVRALAYVLTVPNVMILLEDSYGLSAAEAGHAAAWAVRALLTAYAGDPHVAAPHIADPHLAEPPSATEGAAR